MFYEGPFDEQVSFRSGSRQGKKDLAHQTQGELRRAMRVEYLLAVASVLLMYCGNSQANYITVYQKQSKNDNEDCAYNGYIPGGGVKGIEPIASPVATGFTGAIGTVAGIIGKTAGAGRAGTAALAAVASSIEKVAKVASKLSAAFGVFAAAFSIVEAFTKPSPNDILDKVNVAFAQITKDINNRLKAMEGYADGRVIELEQNLIKNEFAVLKRYMTSCIREHNDLEVRTCQRLANKKIYSELPKFQKLRDTFLAGSADLDFYNIRRLEASLPSFRDYASLHLFSLQTLVNSYRSDPSSGDVKRKLELYLGDLKSFGKQYRDYAYWAYDQIYQRQIKDNIEREDFADLSRKVGDVWEGWPGALTYKKQVFPVKCNPEDKQADINKCELIHLVRWDGKQPSGTKRVTVYCASGNRGDGKCLLNSLKVTAKSSAIGICKKYLGALEEDLKTYWKKELLDVADLWNEVSKKAAAAPEMA